MKLANALSQRSEPRTRIHQLEARHGNNRTPVSRGRVWGNKTKGGTRRRAPLFLEIG